MSVRGSAAGVARREAVQTVQGSSRGEPSDGALPSGRTRTGPPEPVQASARARRDTRGRATTPLPRDAFAAAFSRAAHPLVMLDYDGTLTPLAPTPEDAKPDLALKAVLEQLSQRRGAVVAIVSGRMRSELEAWFGGLNVWLVAEHGAAWRSPQSSQWQSDTTPDTRERIALARKIMASHPVDGSLIEEKPTGVAWHYRRCPDQRRARATAAKIARLLQLSVGGPPLHVLHDSTDAGMVVEVSSGNKGTAARRLLQAHPQTDFVVGMGDAKTDEDLFRALATRADAWTIGVGRDGSTTEARYRVADVAAVRETLESLV